MSTPEKKEEGEPSAPAPKATALALPPNKGTDRTVELDLAQVDLLDLPLPPSSSPKIGSTSKGPPPLPPSLPPEPHADAAAADALATEHDSAAPALTAPALTAPALTAPALTPAPPAAAAAAQVSARRLLEGGTPAASGSPALRFAMGLGAATLVCAGLWFGWRALHKSKATSPVATASAIASAAASAPAPMRTITIAPIEMIDTSADRAAASAPEATTTKPAVGAAGSGTAHPATTTHTAPGGTSVKPHNGGSDDVIKVEN